MAAFYFVKRQNLLKIYKRLQIALTRLQIADIIANEEQGKRDSFKFNHVDVKNKKSSKQQQQ